MIRRILNITGTVIMVLLIVAVIPLTVPKVFGYKIYNVQTASMTPALPVGTAIFVKDCEFSNISEGDIITFSLESGTNLVETHRVVRINTDSQSVNTKGDANAAEDVNSVDAARIIGKVTFHIPWLGSFAVYLSSSEGMAFCVAVFAAVLLMWFMADRIKRKESEQTGEKNTNQ